MDHLAKKTSPEGEREEEPGGQAGAARPHADADSVGLLAGALAGMALAAPPALPASGVLVVDNSASLALCEATLAAARVVAWDCEGVDLGRTGEVCLVQLAVPACCFLLDVTPGVACQAGTLALIKKVLANAFIVKIIHDPAKDADALLHLHGISAVEVHDTQAWHETIHTRLSKRPNVNDSLAAFGCSTNAARDSSIYKINYKFWSTRPLTAEMIEWASGDITKLFELRERQIEAAGGVGSKLAQQAHAQSQKRLGCLRDCVTQLVRIHSTQIGNFIGRQGSNIQLLERSTGAQFWSRHAIPGGFDVYAKDIPALRRAVDACDKFTRAYQRRTQYMYDDY